MEKQLKKKQHPYQLFLGCLSKKVRHSEVIQYLKKFGSGIRVKLASKRKEKQNRGHGRILCPNINVYNTLLSIDHHLDGRKFIIERLKDSSQLLTKYSSLKERKIKVLIPLSKKNVWTNASFLEHFESFGEIEMCHLLNNPIMKDRQHFQVGNVTYKSKNSIKLLEVSNIEKRMDYRIIKGQTKFSKNKENTPERHILPYISQEFLQETNNYTNILNRRSEFSTQVHLSPYYHINDMNNDQHRLPPPKLTPIIADRESSKELYAFLRMKREDIDMNHGDSNITLRQVEAKSQYSG